MIERVLLFGDTTGTKVQDVCLFVKTVHCLYGGSFPSHEEDLPDTKIAEKTCRFLAKAGISDPLPLVICGSTQERAEQILQICNTRRKQNGEGLYLIIDKDPHSFAEAVKSVIANGNDYQAEILKSITVIRLGTEPEFDRLDKETGIRETSLPHPYNPFPAHPTPAS